MNNQYVYRLLALALLLPFLGGCSANQGEGVDPPGMEEAEEASILSLNAGKTVTPDAQVDFYVEKELELSLYEPEEGCYLGAYILSNKQVAFEIASFERLTEKEHSMYTFNTKMGNPFPTDWVLSCIAGMKTPNIVLTPENESYPFTRTSLIETAKKFGEFYVPIFLQFYPEPMQKGYDREGYIAFYREAREIFREYASNVAFVWCVSADDLLDVNAYYPGDEYVDWVGITVYETIDLSAESHFSQDIFDKIDYAYYAFQERKPIMLSQLGVSHFSSVNHAYYSKEAGEEIIRIYDKIAREYPRIKAVVYMDYNGMDSVNQKSGRDNFSVTDNENILAYYKEAVAGNHFLSVTDFGAGGEMAAMLVKSPFTAYRAGEAYFVSENSLAYDMGISVSDAAQRARYGREIGTSAYYDTKIIELQESYKITKEKGGNQIVARR